MINGKKVLGLIPARGGSKRVPSKNLQKLGEQTLLEITVSQALASQFIDKVVVSSEDESILNAAKQAGSFILERPVSLSRDDTPGIAPVLHAIHLFDSFDYVILLQVTSPFRVTADIDAALQLCIDKKASACVSVCRPVHHPAWMFHIDTSGKLIPLLQDDMPVRSQDLPLCYVLNGAIYIAEREVLIKKESFIFDKTIPYEMPSERSLDIDTEYDLFLARAIHGIQRDAALNQNI